MPLRNVNQPTEIEAQFGDELRNATKTHISTNILLFASGVNGGYNPIGAVKSIRIDEGRQLARTTEVGTDGIIDIVPSGSATVTGSCEITRFNGKRAAEALGRGFIHLKSQRMPFDIVIHDIFRDSNPNGSAVVVTTIKNVWLNKIGYNYASDNFVIVDSIGWEAEDISSVYAGTASSAISDVSQVFLNRFEVEADTGRYRGALDGAGMINAFTNNPAEAL